MPPSGILSLALVFAHMARVATADRVLSFQMASYLVCVVRIATNCADGASCCVHHEALLNKLFCKNKGWLWRKITIAKYQIIWNSNTL